MCQMISWIALQMAQKQLDKLWEKLQQLDQDIKQQELKIDEALENDKPERVINGYKERRDRLVNETKEWRQHLSALQARLASQSGEVLAAA